MSENKEFRIVLNNIKKVRTKMLTVRISPNTMLKLKKIAGNNKIKKSELVRGMIEYFTNQIYENKE